MHIDRLPLNGQIPLKNEKRLAIATKVSYKNKILYDLNSNTSKWYSPIIVFVVTHSQRIGWLRVNSSADNTV